MLKQITLQAHLVQGLIPKDVMMDSFQWERRLYEIGCNLESFWRYAPETKTACIREQARIKRYADGKGKRPF
jgi:hypothetical protein